MNVYSPGGQGCKQLGGAIGANERGNVSTYARGDDMFPFQTTPDPLPNIALRFVHTRHGTLCRSHQREQPIVNIPDHLYSRPGA